jgi:glyoxylase I family protein
LDFGVGAAMRIRRFLHPTLLITDLKKSAHFYGTVLGMEQNADRALSFPGLWYQIGAIQLHLIVQPTVICDLQDAERWGRNRHYAFAVDSIADAQARLTDYGYSYQASHSGRPALFVKDPDGNIIELGEVELGEVALEAV